ncbi:hypothetical protein H257_08858 [Aphanomyces astaci]|uniref:Uncharacterized protein n=1 Tax=Aphanomyces astaci TaxID=112090 RepID=W4GDU0_APHAT|nr:hypothetical protein H257_08858 [Aphanomyces astaci]ETV77441.1 hypothetical protein H257_08858 [Aphanomyces astaci]|eukprot:XP_009833228.1 hypothetical protein H257_08858 [Aphanomyces astaci]
MDGLNQGPARTQLFRTYQRTFEEAVRIALSYVEQLRQPLHLTRLNRLPPSDPSDRVRIKMTDSHTASQPRIIVDVPINFDGFDSLNMSQSWIHRRAADHLPPSTTNPLGPTFAAMSNDLALSTPVVRLLALVCIPPSVPPTESLCVVIGLAPSTLPIAASILASTFIEEA